MQCPACGKTLVRRRKYCTNCGEQLRAEETTAAEKLDARFDDYVDGIFWITVFGLGLIIGGMAVMKQVLHLNQELILAYLGISSFAFLTVFGICLWQIIVLARLKHSPHITGDTGQFDTNQLAEASEPRRLGEAISITDETTRTLDPKLKEPIPR